MDKYIETNTYEAMDKYSEKERVTYTIYIIVHTKWSDIYISLIYLIDLEFCA